VAGGDRRLHRLEVVRADLHERREAAGAERVQVHVEVEGDAMALHRGDARDPRPLRHVVAARRGVGEHLGRLGLATDVTPGDPVVEIEALRPGAALERLGGDAVDVERQHAVDHPLGGRVAIAADDGRRFGGSRTEADCDPQDGLVLIDPGITGSELDALADDVPRYAMPACAEVAGQARERAQMMARSLRPNY
jgi:hypothetical protein